MSLLIEPLTPERWSDFEALFISSSACRGCWCMWWKLKRKDFNAASGEGNKRAMRVLVEAGAQPGLLAYDADEPIGWCAVEPRASYPVLARSHPLKPVDDTEVWSITCFVVRPDRQGQGVASALLEAAVDFVAQRGGSMLEAYPYDAGEERLPGAWVWTGLPVMFLRAGFEEVARRKPQRPIFRRRVELG